MPVVDEANWQFVNRDLAARRHNETAFIELDSFMRLPQINDFVGLKEDLPNQQLRAGDTGMVCSIWFLPNATYEVEFQGGNLIDPTRVLLASNQFRLLEKSILQGKN
jgi:hypothetical protein